jgi:gamma-glutamylcyclotransferase (GGCT)/AIG2-like uncharacterized protein YtfP
MQNIFVYGTLQSPEIIKKLTGKSFKSTPAVLQGYKRYWVKESVYPAVIQQIDEQTTGLVLENVDDLSFDIISFYEGDEYGKKKVTVNLNGIYKDVLTFVWVNGNEFLENKDWNLDNFEETFLEYYLEMVIPETLETFHRNQ